MTQPHDDGSLQRTKTDPGIHESDSAPPAENQSTETTPYIASDVPGQQSDLPANIGRYAILKEIGRGGMGVVYEGKDETLHRTLAVKVLLEKHADKPGLTQRFLDEAQIMGRLQHPGVAPIHDLGTLADGRPFFSMKQIEGKTLGKILKESDEESRLPEWLSVFESICQTIGYAHSRKILHRDLKPNNIMVGAFGEVQVMDWGLAKSISQEPGNESTNNQADDSGNPAPDQDNLTQAGTILGTPAFMAPEQARGEIDNVDERSDVFGLGGILCVILTGNPPFTGANRSEVMLKASGGDLEDTFAQLDTSGAEKEWIDLAKHCLSPDRNQRPNNGGEVAEAVSGHLARIQQQLKQAELERTAVQVKAAEERKRRRVSTALMATAVVFFLSIFTGWQWYSWNLSQQQKTLEAEILVNLKEVERSRQKLYARLENDQETAKMLSNFTVWENDLERIEIAWKRAETVRNSGKRILGDTWNQRMSQTEKAVKLDRKHLEIAKLLDSARQNTYSNQGGPLRYKNMHDRFTQAYRSIGLDFSSQPIDELAENIRNSPIRYVLAAGIDHWAYYSNDNEQFRIKLLAVVRQADPDPWRDQLRDVKLWKDADTLVRMAEECKTQKQTPQVIGILAWRLYDAKKQEESRALLRRTILEQPGDFWLHYLLGWLARDRTEQASHSWVAISIRPEYGPAYVHLSLARSLQNRQDLSFTYIKKATEVSPNNAVAFRNLGTQYFHRNELDKCHQAYAKAVELDPTYPQAHESLASTYVLKKNYTKAFYHFRKAIELNPKFVRAHYSLAMALLDRGQNYEAHKVILKAQELDPMDVHVNSTLALIHNQRGDFATSELYHRKVMAVSNQSAPHLINFASVLKARGKFKEALTYFQKGEKIAKASGQNYPTQQWIQTCQNNLTWIKIKADLLSGKVKYKASRLLTYAKFSDVTLLNHLHAHRLYEIAFAADPNLEQGTNRYLAARCAVMATFEANDSDIPLSPGERQVLRNKALVWLRKELSEMKKTVTSGRRLNVGKVRNRVANWLKEADLIGVREPEPLAHLSDEERLSWERFWDELQSLREGTGSARYRN